MHTVFGGPGLCEWICLCIDVCVLCLSHSSGLVWPVCKQACTTSGDKAAKGRARAAGMQGEGGGLPGDAGTLEKRQIRQ